MQAELLTLLVISVVGQSFFAPFEVEVAGWRKVLKWSFVVALTIGAQRLIGHAAVAVPIVLGLLGLAIHFWWCQRNGIHPLRATPRKRYYTLRGWEWPD